jgi:hypothetical protein
MIITLLWEAIEWIAFVMALAVGAALIYLAWSLR